MVNDTSHQNLAMLNNRHLQFPTLVHCSYTCPMIKIEYPNHPFKIRGSDGMEMIFDEYRKSWVRLTEEEWVRQNFLVYLIKEKQYPPSLIAVEKELMLGELKKRFDVLVYDRSHSPWMMIECKAMNVSLDHKVLDQLLRYHMSIEVPYLVITNGSYCAAFEKVNGKLSELHSLPEYVR